MSKIYWVIGHSRTYLQNKRRNLEQLAITLYFQFSVIRHLQILVSTHPNCVPSLFHLQQAAQVTALHQVLTYNPLSIMKHRYSRIVQSLLLYIPIFLLVNSFTNWFYDDLLIQERDQYHRLAWSSDDDEYISHRFQITLTGTPTTLPQDDDYSYFEHKLFAYLNRQLTSRDLQISRVHVVQEKTELKYNGYSGVKSFTILVGNRREEEDEDEEVDNGEAVESWNGPDGHDPILDDKNESKERELNNPGSSANKLITQVDIEGRDLSGLMGHFKKHVEGVINVGYQAIIDDLVRAADARPYFKGVSWLGAKSVGSTPSPYGRSNGIESFDNPDQDEKDNEPSIPSQVEDDVEQGENKDEEQKKQEKPKTHKARPMNAKAIEFRIISGSIFLSLCLTAVLSNAIRLLARKREERRRRMEKARQAYEAPKNANNNKGGSEKKFTGLLDDGDQYR